MCLGIPMLLVEMDGSQAIAEVSGVRRRVFLDLLPEARLGDYVIVHAGYAIQRLDEAEAGETLEYLAAYLTAGENAVDSDRHQ
jgi:hydrogenase expression/formation protein HypC